MKILRLIAAAPFRSVIAMHAVADSRRGTAGFEIDDLDVQLLNIVQADNQLTAEALSKRVPLSPSSALRRLARLRDIGLIERQVAVLANALLERRASGMVLVKLNSQSSQAIQALKRRLIDCPQVQMLFEISGAFDLMLLVVERDIAAFHAFTGEALAESPYVQRFEISFVKTRLKATLAIPMDAADTR